MLETSLTLHETMEIHEMLNLKTACMVKSKMLQGLVFDQELKALLEKDVRQCKTAVTDLQRILGKTQPK